MKTKTFFSRMVWDTSQLLRKSLTSLKALTLLLVMLMSVNMWGAKGEVYYTLTCTKNSSNSAYASTYDVTIDGLQWNAPGNQTLGEYWRIGGGKATSATERIIKGKSKMGSVIGSVKVYHNGVSATQVAIPSAILTVASDANFTTVVETITVSNPSVSSAGNFEFKPNTNDWPKDCYYKITLNYTKSNTDNGGLNLTKIEFIEGGGSSCTSRTITFAGSPTTVEKTTADVAFKYAASIDVADGQTIGYTSSDTKVATVAADGTVTIVGAGTTEITASVSATETYCEASASYTINVTKPIFSCWTGSLNCDFTKISGFSEWGSTYKQHVVEYTNLTVTFASANKQGSTITDCPVTKGNPVTFVAAENKVITQIHVKCKQWSADKAQTITLNYSTDGGTNYQTLNPSVTSSDFEIESTNLPEGTNAVKLTFSSSSNQIGIASACVTIEDAATLNSISVKTAPKLEYNANETFNPAGLVINAVYSNGTKEIAYAGNESKFTFTPSTSTALTSDNDTVNIKYTAQDNQTANVDQNITVNLLPTTITLASAIQNIGAGEVVTDLQTWVASVTGTQRTFEFTSGDNNVFSIDGVKGQAGDNAGQTTVTVKAIATKVYAEATEVVTVNVLAASDPKLEVDPTIVEFTNKVVGQSYTSEKIALMGENLTADATIEISGTDAAMFTAVDGEGNAISSIEQADGEILTDIYVKYAPTAASPQHSATMTISSTTANVEVALSGSAKASYTVKWSINGVIDDSKNETVIDGNKVTVVPSAESCDEDNIAFLGWTNNTIADAAEAPAILFTDVASAPAVTDNITYHAVFAEIGGTGEMLDKELLNVKYGDAAWSVSSSNTTDKKSFTLLHTSGYVEVGTLDDWSKVTKVTIYGGTFGGKDYCNLTIYKANGSTTTKWKDVAVSGDSQTGENKYTGGTALTGSGVVRVSSRSGTVSSNGVRVSQVIVYTQEKDITYSHYSTTCVPPLVAPTIETAAGEYCTSVDVVIAKGDNPTEATLQYSVDNGANWNTYSSLNLTATTTVKARVILDPKTSAEAEATYTILPHYSDLTALKETATADVQKACVSFSNLLVNATNVSTVYLTDGTNVYMINKSNHGFSRGQKLSTGEHAILPYKLYNGVLQFNDNAGITVSSSDNETPATTMAVNAITASNYGQLVKIENVIYVADGAYFKDGSDNTIKLGNNIVNASSWVKNGAIYDITGIITTQMIEEVPTLTISPRVKDLDVVSKAEKLNAPSNLTYENLTGSSVTLKWGEVTGAAKYDVEVYDGTTRVKNNQTTSLSYGPTGLTSGKTYTWRVRSVGDDLTTSTSDWTDGTATFTTPAPATLYWIVNGDIEHPFATTTAASEKVVMPTTDPTSACDENYEDFICWVNRPVEGVQTRAPFNYELVADTSKAKSADGDKYFYALFGKVASEGTDVYTLVTEAPDSWAGDYLIAKSESKFANGYYSGTNGIGKEGNYVNLSEFIVDNTIAGEIGNPYHVTFETCDGGYLMKSQSGYYNYKSSNTNGIDSTQSVNTADDYPITIALNDGGTVHMSLTNGAKFQYNNNGSGFFRFYKLDSNQDDCYLYKRIVTPTSYSAYITTCPTFYDITIDDQIVGGEVTADPNATIDAGATIQLTATASAGYTAEGGTWTVTNETTTEAITVNKSNQFTMPASKVTVSYAFVALVDNFQDALHGAAAQTGVGAQYDLPTLANTTEGTRKDAFFKFAGWVSNDTEITTGEPATAKPTILEGKQDATGATYKALWANATETAFVTEECNTAIPTNLHVVNEALTANSAKLDWNNVTNATKYHVSVYQATTLIVEADVESSEYVATELTMGTEYSFTVKAYNGCWGYEADAVLFTTKAEIASHLVTLVAENGQIEIDPDLTEGKLDEGTVATVTATANDGYYFVDWTFTGVTPTSKEGKTATFAMPTKAITITATFAEYPKVTWKMAGQADKVTSSVPDGDKFVIGADNMQPAPDTWTFKEYYKEFAGWMTNSDFENPVFATATTEVPADGLVVNGAVAKSVAPDCSQATKITSNENLDMSALYVMGIEHNSETKYFYNLLDGKNPWAQVSDDYTTNTPYMFTISGTKDALAILCKDGYVKGQTSNFAFSENETTIVLTEDGLMEYSTATETYGLAYNHNSGNGGIRWYKISSISSSSYPLAYLYKVGLIYDNLTTDPSGTQIRPDAKVGMISGICYERDIVAHSGATFYYLSQKAQDESYIVLTEVTGILHAGYPYLFEASDNEIRVIFDGEAIEDENAYNYNGLYGTFKDTPLGDGYCIIVNNKYYRTHDGNDNGCRAHRAYLMLDGVSTTPVEIAPGETKEPATAPRRIRMGGDGVNTPTGNADILSGTESIRKMIINDKMYILRAGKMYDATGKFIK